MPAQRNCSYCATRFTVSDKRRIYCSDRCKTRAFRETKLTCYYCGDIASTKDHMLPQVHGDGAGDVVPCCKECNSTMGAHTAGSIEMRMAFLANQYVKRYQLDKQIPEWDDSEFDELGVTLRSHIRAKILERQTALDRVLHIRARLKDVQRLTRYK